MSLTSEQVHAKLEEMNNISPKWLSYSQRCDLINDVTQLAKALLQSWDENARQGMTIQELWEQKRLMSAQWIDHEATIKRLESTIRDRDKTTADITLYCKLLMDVSSKLENALTGFMKLHAGKQLSPDLWPITISSAQAIEKYARVANGENVGCLEKGETDGQRKQTMQEHRRLIAIVKGEHTTS